MPGPFNYNPAIPQANDQPSQSQGEILQNFDSINDIWIENHYEFAEANAGKHKALQMPIQPAAPTTAVDEYAVYTYQYSTYAGDPAPTTQMVIKKPNTGVRIPFTSSGGTGAGGWSWLSSGLLMKWGEFAIANNSGLQTVTYSATQPAFNNTPLSVMLSLNATGIGAGDPNFIVYLTNSVTASFEFRAYNRTSSAIPGTAAARLNWIAIGPATANGL